MALATRSEFEIEAAPEEVGMSTPGLRNVSRLVQRYIDDGKLPGAISLVARRGKVVHFETYGEMDAERHKPMRSDTIFRFYSMTKPIASVGLMMLYEQGKFQLEDPVSRFIPELAGLKVLAGGTADAYQVRDAAREMTVRDLLSGLPFDRYLEERILGPLGMLDTGFSVPESNVDRFAANYAPQAGTPRYRLVDDPRSSPYTRRRTYFSGSGGLVSTAADYLRFCRMLANGGHLDGARIIGPRTLRLMTINHLPGGKDLATVAQTAGGNARGGGGVGVGFFVLID